VTNETSVAEKPFNILYKCVGGIYFLLQNITPQLAVHVIKYGMIATNLQDRITSQEKIKL